MNQFNELEKAVLNWFQSQGINTSLSKQIESAKFIRREWTKVGFYIHFGVDLNLAPIIGTNFPIDGPGIESIDIDCGGGVLLWGENGHLNCIEMFANGHYFREHIREFKLL
jgi:hypothetical protein